MKSRDCFIPAETYVITNAAPDMESGVSVIVGKSGLVSIEISTDSEEFAFADLTAEKVDELIRALGAARVEISKARPR